MCETSIFKIFFPCLYSFTLPKYRQDPDPNTDPVKIFPIRLRILPKRSGSDRIRIRIRIRNPGTKIVDWENPRILRVFSLCSHGKIRVLSTDFLSVQPWCIPTMTTRVAGPEWTIFWHQVRYYRYRYRYSYKYRYRINYTTFYRI